MYFFEIGLGGNEQHNVSVAFKSLTNRLIILETFGESYDPSDGPCLVIRSFDETNICQSQIESEAFSQSASCYSATIYVNRTNGFYEKDGKFVVHIFTQSRYASLENGLAGPWEMSKINYPSVRLNRIRSQSPLVAMSLEKKSTSECDEFYVYTFGEIK